MRVRGDFPGCQPRHSGGAELGVPGRFWAEDVNAVELEANRYDLIFSAHSFHHFLELEHVMEQVAQALTPRGLFILEEFIGPTQFQWTDLPMELTAGLLMMMPEKLRHFRWGASSTPKGGRPSRRSWRSRPSNPSARPRSRPCSGSTRHRPDPQPGRTIQHLLYNGIAHNFWPVTPESRHAEGVFRVEDALIDAGLLPSDFALLVGSAGRDDRASF